MALRTTTAQMEMNTYTRSSCSRSAVRGMYKHKWTNGNGMDVQNSRRYGGAGTRRAETVRRPQLRGNHQHQHWHARNAASSASSQPNLSLQVSDTFSRVFSNGDERPVILFDGMCNMCNGGVTFILDMDTDARLRMAALQSDVGRGLLTHAGREPNDISSIVLVEKDNISLKSTAILKIGQYLDLPMSLLCSTLLLSPELLRDFTYDTVADNRYRVFGTSKECRLSDPKYADRFL